MTEIEQAINTLRKEMADKEEGSYYHGWMCNIKFAVYDSIDWRDVALHGDKALLDGCEEGAKLFLKRLLQED